MPPAAAAAALAAVKPLPTAAAVALHFGAQHRTYLITGASSGLGLATAKALGAAGGTVVLACRPGAAAEAAAAAVRALSPAGSSEVHLLPLELASSASVRACAAAYAALPLPRSGALSALILNAGIICPTFDAHSPGEDSTLRVNLLGHALLHALLQPHLLAARGEARVVVLASESHRRVQGRALDLAAELPPRAPRAGSAFDCHRAYAFSNLARLLWARALAGRVPYPVIALHPCTTAATAMSRSMGVLDMCALALLIARWELRPLAEGQNAERGARTQTFCAVAPQPAAQALSGCYLSGNLCDGGPCAVVAPSPLGAREDYAQEVLAFVEGWVARERGGGEGKQ